MDLLKKQWTKNDGREFIKYLESLKNTKKKERAKKILNTNMDLLVIATPEIKRITKEIMMGNYISFLDLELNEYYENSAINGFIISQIKDFKLMKIYLDKYVMKIDNWALCDLLFFDVKNNKRKFYGLALKYLEDDRTFVRRIGFVILFNFINDDDYIDGIFNIMN